MWNALAVILTAVVTLVGLQQGVRWALLHEIDQLLIDDIQEITLELQNLPEDEFDSYTSDLNRKANVHRHHGWFVDFLDRDNVPLWRSTTPPAVTFPDKVDLSAMPFTHENYRLIVKKLKRESHRVAALRVGSSLTFLSEDLAIIDRFVLLAAAFVLVLAPLTGYILAGRTVRSVGDIIQTAARLRPSHLDERLPIRGTGDELDQLALTVNGLLDRIAAYLGQKRDFLANAAHELRTPLAAIRSSVEVALNSDRTTAEYQELLLDIIDEGTSLETLVNQLLLISETEAEKIKSEFQVISFSAVVRKGIDMFAGVAESRDIELQADIDEGIHVSGIQVHLRQLVNNLIDNAIKYSAPGGHVNVSLKVDERGELARLTVEDDGIGISREDLPHVFDRFFRAEKSRTRKFETVGTGLGLSICQAVVDAHRGKISCDSELDRGTKFTVEFALVRQPVAAR